MKESVHEIDKRNVVSSAEVYPHQNVDVLKHIAKREDTEQETKKKKKKKRRKGKQFMLGLGAMGL